MKKADAGIALYLLAAVIFFIIPIPSVLLDIMLAFNIAIALIVLMNALFVKEVLDMSFFPTLLLFTTIFRISLNVSSTRLILTTGDPGNVVRTFGGFVGGNNIIIGAIVFIVLILIQFIVINKGSERVAEVTARFTLDAMPGKQMAIDADLNTGIINEKQARERREKIQMESSFFGSMDGATKYVKGDATAGLIITIINLAGGTTMGVMNSGLSVMDALQEFGILTIGDGLVSQIPSLLISLATGILVTKASKEADFGGLLVQQLDVAAEKVDASMCVTRVRPTEAQLRDLDFGWRIVKHVKSNAIVVVSGGHTVGVGAGQMNRVGSAEIALKQAQAAGFTRDLVLASDGFLPFGDTVELAARYGVTAIVQPGGSIRDEESVAKADELGIAMLFTGVRHFKH